MTVIFIISILHLTKITSNGNQQRTKKNFFDQCYQFFDTFKTKDRKIRGNCNLLMKVTFHELE